MSARSVFFGLVLAAASANAQTVVRPVPVQPAKQAEPVPPKQDSQIPYFSNEKEEASGSGQYGSYKITYERDATRRTQLRFVSPEPMTVRVTDNNADVLRDTIPTKLDAKPGRLYRVQISNGRDVVFDQSFEAKEGMVGVLHVTPTQKPVAVVTPTIATTTPAPVPVIVRASPTYPAASGRMECMNTKVLNALADYINAAKTTDDKLWYVGDLTRRGQYYFCVHQVFTTLKLFDRPKHQLDALVNIAPLIVDKKNNFKVPQLFKDEDDRDQARRILQAAQ